MLTEKYKDFIERTAKKLQNSLPSFEAPNKYNFLEIKNWLKSSGAEILYGETNRTIDDVIYFDFLQKGQSFEELVANDFEKRKILFHEMWHFIAHKIYNPDNNGDMPCKDFDLIDDFSEKSISPIEISANYFSRAMLFPEKPFIETVMKNIDIDGRCDIFKVAEVFSSSYVDVIARGNDLNLWNTKV